MRSTHGIIYGICDPREAGHIRYVGQTGYSIQRRLRQHLKNGRQGNRLRVSRWIAACLANGVTPTASQLDHVVITELDQRETFWILKLRGDGHQLLNQTIGGKAPRGYRHTQETKNKISAAHKGKKHSPEWRQRLRDGLRAPEMRAKLGHMKGKKQGCSPERHARIIEALSRPEVRAKLSQSSRGNQSNKGRTFSPEHRAKIAAARRAYWARQRKDAT